MSENDGTTIFQLNVARCANGFVVSGGAMAEITVGDNGLLIGSLLYAIDELVRSTAVELGEMDPGLAAYFLSRVMEGTMPGDGTRSQTRRNIREGPPKP